MMDNILRTIKISFLALACSCSFSSCITDDDLDDSTTPDNPGRVILIYAVAANNLAYNYTLDMSEIKSIAPALDLKNNKVLVYSVNTSNECSLQTLEKNGKGEWDFRNLQTFPELPLSVEKSRITEIIDYVNLNYGEYPAKGLILWSHATGWIPWLGNYPKNTKRKSFGSERYNGIYYQCNITDLASAIPEGIFDFIWFDCCYMANIETVYQLRKKADYIAGYVTEIHEDGMPYNLTMPYLLRLNADLAGAAEALYGYYTKSNITVTVSVMDCLQLENLALEAKQIMADRTPPAILSNVQNYSRLKGYPFYDLGQLLKSYSGLSTQDIENIDSALDKAVICKYISNFDFNWKPMNVADYSGLSVHNYIDNNTEDSQFYTTLDWYKATR